MFTGKQPQILSTISIYMVNYVNIPLDVGTFDELTEAVGKA